MKLILIFTSLMTILQAFRIAIYYLRNDVSFLKKVIELIILIAMVILSYFNLEDNTIILTIYLATILSFYILVMFIYEKLFKQEYMNTLSVKNGIDMADSGILFLDDKNDIVLMNNIMSGILKEFNIKQDYINNLIKKSIEKTDDDYLLKFHNKIYQLRIINSKEIILNDISELYKLYEQEKLQNKEIKENNEKLLETIKNLETIEKSKNLLKIKNEYHDIIGHRLALFTKFLEQNSKDVKTVLFLLDSIYQDFDSQLTINEKLSNLMKMYKVIGININLNGKLPEDEKVANIFFEIIRESITNAIIHADSKNIKVRITKYFDRIEMIITNDGKKPNLVIYENEGIKGMRRKLATMNGSLNILTDKGFVLKIVI